MQKIIMRDHVLDALGLIRGDLEADYIDRFLDRIYQREIPLRILGASDQGYIEIPLSTGTDTYHLDNDAFYINGDTSVAATGRIISVKKPIFIYDPDDKSKKRALKYFDDQNRFWELYSFDEDQGYPVAVLAYERELILRSFPDTERSGWIMRSYANLFRAEIPVAGLNEEMEAWTCIDGATHYIASAKGMEPTRDDYAEEFNKDLGQLSHKHGSRQRGGNYVGDVW